MHTLRIVFLGTPDFAVAHIEAIQGSIHQIVGVVTIPDRKIGRGRKLYESPVKQYAQSHGLYVMQPQSLKSPDFISDLKSLDADLFIVVAFRMLPEQVWRMPVLGTLNVHASLLPQYRGAAPINWAIIHGDTQTGVTVFRLKHEIDTGDIILQLSLPITHTDNVGTLHDKLMYLGTEAIMKSIDMLVGGDVSYLTQPLVSHLNPAPKIYKENSQINWNQGIVHIHNFIRGLSPYPSAWSILINDEQEISFKIFAAHYDLIEVTHCGLIETNDKDELKISGIDGWIIIDSLQIAGKKRMATSDFLRGFTFSPNLRVK